MKVKRKLTNKQKLIASLCFIFNVVLTIAIALAMLAVKQGNNTFIYLSENMGKAIFVIAGVSLLYSISFLYLFFESSEVLVKLSKQIELFVLLDLSFVFSFVVTVLLDDPNARPFGFFAVMCATLLGRKPAIFLNVINALLIFIMDINLSAVALSSTEFLQYCSCMLISFYAGTLVIFFSPTVKTRLQSVLIFFVLLLPIEVIITVMEILFGGMTSEWILLAYGAIGAVLSTLLYMILLPVFELLFSELTTFRLREITAPNARLMKKLKNEAPGTYNHSVVVAQLTEACAIAIGEDGELARAAALYHDVGKLTNPEMFTENQSDKNIHNELPPELSAEIIRSHARDGAKLIKKYHLPEFLADVAVQHHGTLPIKYFYVKALKMSDGEIQLADFSYPGPVPETRIAAIIMIADAVEAATRSLADRSAANIEKLAGSLIEERMNLDQFVNCNITLSDLTVISRTIAQSLSGVYHNRISYPKLKIGKKD
ncbi:MAG: HDIG domain-containing metalloprotein [Candidatus Coproplasma sp.]